MKKKIEYEIGYTNIEVELEENKVLSISIGDGVFFFNAEQSKELYNVLQDIYSEEKTSIFNYPPGVRSGG